MELKLYSVSYTKVSKFVKFNMPKLCIIKIMYRKSLYVIGQYSELPSLADAYDWLITFYIINQSRL